MSTDEEGTHFRLLAYRREVIAPKVREHRGRIVKHTGDGALVEFGSVVEAVRCALDVQRTILARNAGLPQDRRIDLRIGVNLGDVIVAPDDIYGHGVNIAEGFSRNPDYNSGTQDGFGYYQATQKNGRRWSTSRAFLDPARQRPNLRIETEALATRILFDGKRAVGVAYLQRGEAREARCGREAILAAGAVKSPHLLELSGVGNPELLKAADIPVRHELRGVGENYRDHYSSRLTWRVKLPVTLNEQTRGLALAKEVIKY